MIESTYFDPSTERRRTSCTAIAIPFVVMLLVPQVVCVGEITTSRLVACLPGTTESVMVWNYVELTRDDSCMRAIARKKLEKLGTVPQGDDPKNIKYVVLRHVKAAGPVLQVKGGSEFVVPPGADRVNFKTRAIWRTRDPLDGLRKALETETEIRGRIGRASFRGMPIHQFRIEVVLNEIGSMRILEDRFVALPDERVVFVTESRDEMEHMLGSFGAPTPVAPGFLNEMKPWAEFEAVTAAPLCVMRMPRRERGAESDELALCLVLQSVQVPYFVVRAPAGHGQSIIRTVKELFPREVPQWQIAEDRTGTAVRIPFGDCADPIPDLATRISVLFGNKLFSDLATDTNGN